jgi:hypothetical protein
MFNSKKIKKLNQQQDLLDAKVNSLAHGQKSLSEDFEVHFKRLRQIMYTFETSISKDIASEVQTELSLRKKQHNAIQKTLNEIENKQKHQSILFATKIQLLTDQIVELKNKIERPKTQEISQPLGFAEAMKVPMPTWTMPNGTSQSSPIQDKMKLEVSEIFDEAEKPTENENSRKRKPTKPIEERKSFSVNVTLPEKVLNYLHNRSSEKAISTTCRNVFEREGKLVFAPLSYEITKNFGGSNKKAITIEVSKNTYLVIHKIANDMKLPITQVASNFVATMDSVEATQIGLKYSAFNSKDLQTKAPIERRGVGRPKKK